MSEDRYRSILEHAPVMIGVYRPDGTLDLWNRESERRLGWTAAELKSKTEPLATLFADMESQSAFRQADGSFRESEVRTKDGSVRVQRWATFQLPDGSRITVAHDLTEHRALEARDARRERLDALQSLSLGIAHHFNNLLTIISCAADLAKESLGPVEPPHRFHEAMEDIRTASDRGAELLRALLTFSGRRRLRRRPTILDEVIREQVPTLRLLLPDAVALELSLNAGRTSVLADEPALRLLLRQLAENALEAIDGPGRLRLSTSMSARNRVCLSMSDSGVGMAPRTLERAFEPFFTMAAPNRGGLGLSVVRGLVAQHEGTIELESTLGGGTEVTIELPALRERDIEAGNHAVAS